MKGWLEAEGVTTKNGRQRVSLATPACGRGYLPYNPALLCPEEGGSFPITYQEGPRHA